MKSAGVPTKGAGPYLVRRTSFLEHPLCKELNIGSLVVTTTEQNSPKNEMAPRSFGRRCAMDFGSTTSTNPPCEEEEELGDMCKNAGAASHYSPDPDINDKAKLNAASMSTTNIVLQMPISHRREKRPSFLEHPLCKELNISAAPPNESSENNMMARSRIERRCAMTLVTTTHVAPPDESSMNNIARSRIERRCAMTLITATQISPSEVQKDLDARKDNANNPPEYIKKEPFRQNDTVGIISESFARVCCEPDRTRHPSCQSIDWSTSITPAVRSHEEIDVNIVSTTDNDGPYIKRIRDTRSSDFAYNANLLPDGERRRSSLRILLTALKDTGESLITNLILSGDEEVSDSDNILLEEMRKIEDQNIWNTVRKRHYEE